METNKVAYGAESIMLENSIASSMSAFFDGVLLGVGL